MGNDKDEGSKESYMDMGNQRGGLSSRKEGKDFFEKLYKKIVNNTKICTH